MNSRETGRERDVRMINMMAMTTRDERANPRASSGRAAGVVHGTSTGSKSASFGWRRIDQTRGFLSAAEVAVTFESTNGEWQPASSKYRRLSAGRATIQWHLGGVLT